MPRPRPSPKNVKKTSRIPSTSLQGLIFRLAKIILRIKIHARGCTVNKNGSYKGVIKREAVYKGTNKDYLSEAKPRASDHFTCEGKPSIGKRHFPRA